MKKSLEKAMAEAKVYSEKLPNITVYVMDKHYQQSVVCASEWVRKERILCGWHTVASFLNGEEIRR